MLLSYGYRPAGIAGGRHVKVSGESDIRMICERDRALPPPISDGHNHDFPTPLGIAGMAGADKTCLVPFHSTLFSIKVEPSGVCMPLSAQAVKITLQAVLCLHFPDCASC